MGGKSDLNSRIDRPESGGADRDDIQEKSGLLERDKQKFAEDQAEKRESVPEHAKNANHAPFSIDNERNPDPNNK